jgi:acyl transferase domain-containing protein
MANEEKLREYLKRVTVDLHETRARLREVEAQGREPVAIVGIACRFPGGVGSAGDLWELVHSGRDAISAFPTDRGWEFWERGGFDTSSGPFSVGEGGFMYDMPDFDAAFFGISPREALAMDPQQRLLLETSWEAMEDAQIDPLSLRGSRVGVFTGMLDQDYSRLMYGELSPDLYGYAGIGNAASVASGRVAYSFGFEGPTMTVDTACSSSLVALHIACGALRGGECSLALAGGVSILATPTAFASMAIQQGLAPDGRCKSFSADADGTGWSEGVAVLLLERLSDARRLGHPVAAVVRGSAINQDGASNGMSAPNGPSQQRVIRQALANAGLQPHQVDVVEAHGTGTRLGDPIEAQALLATYGQNRDGREPLWLGSIKSNIGHTQAAAGMAGVIKMVMALKHGALPKTLHVGEPTGQVDWSVGAVSLLTDSRSWPVVGEPRRAGVSSFGMSGTNAHVILEEAPVAGEAPVEDGAPDIGAPSDDLSGGAGAGEGTPDPVDWGVIPFAISGRGVAGLRGQASRLRTYILDEPALDAFDVGFSLAASRPALKDRAVLLAGDREELLEGLDVLARGESAANVVEGIVRGDEPQIAFLFTGQGAQRPGMGRELYGAFPAFRNRFDEVCEHFDELLECSLADVVIRGAGDSQPGAPRAGSTTSAGEGGGGGSLDETTFTQTGLFAFEMALFSLVETWGVRPSYLIGHSIGELVAACIAGLFSLEDACRLVAARARLMNALPASGAMVSVQASEQEATEMLAGLEESVALAAVNGPSSIVLSGEEGPVLELTEMWRKQGRKTKRLNVSHAFHSPLMEPILAEFELVASGVSFSEPSIPIVSNLTGQLASAELYSAEYWVRHARETVRFADGVRWLHEQGIRSFIELGPDGVLSAMVQDCLASPAVADGNSAPVLKEGGSVLASVALARTGRPEVQSLLTGLAHVWTRGAPVDWAEVLRVRRPRQVPLPKYAFQRSRYWLQTSGLGHGEVSSVGLTATDHPLLGAAVALANGQGLVFTGRLSTDTHPWLADHQVMGAVLLVGTAFLEIALHAGAQVGCELVHELTLEAPLVLSPGEAVQLQVSTGAPDESGRRRITIHSRPDAGATDGMRIDETWTRHADGTLVPLDVQTEQRWFAQHGDVLADTQWPPADAELLQTDDLYERLAEWGLEYGPLFQGLRRAWRHGEELLMEVALPGEQQAQAGTFGAHPALLDAALHGAGIAQLGADSNSDQVRMPFSWGGVSLHARGASQLRARLSAIDDDTISLVASDEAGLPVLSVRTLAVRAVSADRFAVARGQREGLYRVDWTAVPVGARRADEACVVLGPADGGLAASIGHAGSATPAQSYSDLSTLAKAVHEGQPMSKLALLDCATEHVAGEDELVGSVHANLHTVIAAVQQWLAEELFADARLVVLTSGAVSTSVEEGVPCLEMAPLWGFIRSAQHEHPGRLVLVDVDGEDGSWAVLATALDLEEPQMAVRHGVVLAPRLAPASAPFEPEVLAERALTIDPQGTVLVTGGTGDLGALVAVHLVKEHGARNLLLTSRRGPKAPGAEQLQAELRALGAQATVVACDVADQQQLEQLIAAIPEECPLNAVVHTAGVVDDGVVASLTPERVDGVLAPKVDGAWHLHRLTKELDLSAFVLFSSAAGVFGSSGQGNYAAANAFLDALAAQRHTQGLPAISLAWAAWEQAGMAARVRDSDLMRFTRLGVGALQREEGLALFDAALTLDETLAVMVRLDMATLRSHADAGMLPALLRGVVRAPLRRAGAGVGPSLASQLVGVPREERLVVVSDFVRREVASVLGHSTHEGIDIDLTFKDLGFDSLAAIEFRNRLNAISGSQLPATLIFDYPTPIAVANHLFEGIDQDPDLEVGSAAVELTRLEHAVSLASLSPSERAEVEMRLREILSQLAGARAAGEDGAVAQTIEAASAEEMIEFIDNTLGAS